MTIVSVDNYTIILCVSCDAVSKDNDSDAITGNDFIKSQVYMDNADNLHIDPEDSNGDRV